MEIGEDFAMDETLAVLAIFIVGIGMMIFAYFLGKRIERYALLKQFVITGKIDFSEEEIINCRNRLEWGLEPEGDLYKLDKEE